LKTSVHNLPLFTEGYIPSVPDPFFHETDARNAGFDLIAGIDEVGRGPLAGPVAAAAVILPKGLTLPGIKDSKQMTEKAREEAFSVIHHKALAVSIGVVSHHFIDEFNILKASLEAMKQAVLSLRPAAEYLLVDGIHSVPVPIPQKCLKKGDQRSMSISAASVMAKVYRDRIMRSYDERFPEYGFRSNKGYGTQKHLAALHRYGPCPIHRLTFKRVLEGK
jgi:ribonuclease HII